MRPHLLTLTFLMTSVLGCPDRVQIEDMSPQTQADASSDLVVMSPQDMPRDLEPPTPDLPVDMTPEDTPADIPQDTTADLSPETGVTPDVPVDMPSARTPMFVGVGNWGLRASTSDGVTWQDQGNPPGGNDHSPDLLRGVGFGDGTFIAVGGDRNSMIMRSTDGVTWQEDRHPAGRQWLGGVAHLDGVWVAAGGTGSNLRSTDDGLTWTQHPGSLSSAGRAVAAGDGAFVVVGDGGLIAVSRDAGQTWTEHPQAGRGFGSVAYGAGIFVAVGAHWMNPGFETSCVHSSDATTWTPCPLSSDRFGAVSVSDGRLIVSMSQGIAVTSDGVTWSTIEGSLPERIAGRDGVWVGESYRRRWSSGALESGWASTEYERGFRALVGGWVE